ncbi:hypothetical protein JCM10908_003772 [Rhodotorula pacifica]|uniref:uncharacterized protein n=1 Tax=Rhodotorula pacifica TaxID=1495444 RepID=UPI003173CF55
MEHSNVPGAQYLCGGDSDTSSDDSDPIAPCSDSDREDDRLEWDRAHGEDWPPRQATSLLSLPPELLYKIFDHLQHVKAGKQPICRALWPMTRRNLFRDVQINTNDRLSRFATLLRPVPPTFRDLDLLAEIKGTGSLIRHLSIIARPAHSRDPSITSTALSNARTVLSRALRVKSLELHGPRSLEYLTPRKMGLTWLRELEELTLDDFSEANGRWDSEPLSRLRRFRRLKELHLDLSDIDRFSPPGSVSQATLPSVPQVKQLYLHVGGPIVPAEFARSVALFTGIKKLDIELNLFDEGANDENDPIDLGQFLQAVPTTKLSDLSIDFLFVDELDPDDDGLPNLTIEADLARFHRLTRLFLCCNIFNRGGELLDILAAHLPLLQHLTFDHYAHVRASKLIAFVRKKGGSTRAMKELQYSAIFGSLDDEPPPSSTPEDRDVVSGAFLLSDIWTLPHWQHDFTSSQAEELIEAGRETGVRITGDILEAMEVEEVREREQAYLDERREEYLYDLSSLFPPE